MLNNMNHPTTQPFSESTPKMADIFGVKDKKTSKILTKIRK